MRHSGFCNKTVIELRFSPEKMLDVQIGVKVLRGEREKKEFQRYFQSGHKACFLSPLKIHKNVWLCRKIDHISWYILCFQSICLTKSHSFYSLFHFIVFSSNQCRLVPNNLKLSIGQLIGVRRWEELERAYICCHFYTYLGQAIATFFISFSNYYCIHLSIRLFGKVPHGFPQ